MWDLTEATGVVLDMMMSSDEQLDACAHMHGAVCTGALYLQLVSCFRLINANYTCNREVIEVRMDQKLSE